MPEEQSVSEQKFMKGANSMMGYITTIIVALLTFAGIWVSVKKNDVAETKVSAEFTQMAVGFAQKASENQVLIEENNRMKIELQQCREEKLKDNSYLKKKVLYPLKKKYNGH